MSIVKFDAGAVALVSVILVPEPPANFDLFCEGLIVACPERITDHPVHAEVPIGTEVIFRLHSRGGLPEKPG